MTASESLNFSLSGPSTPASRPDEVFQGVTLNSAGVVALIGGLVKMVGHRENTGYGLVTEDERALLEAQLLTAMDHTQPQDFVREWDLVRLLYLAHKIAPEKGGGLVQRLAERDEVFLATVRSLRRVSHSITVGDLVSRANEEFGWSTLCDLFGEENARRRMDQLLRLEVAKTTGDGLDEETLAALRLAEDYAVGRRWEEG